VKSLLKPVTFCVALVLVALPGVAVACEWACDASTSQSMAGHHHSSEDQTPQVDSTAGVSDRLVVGAVPHGCGLSAADPALTARVAKVLAPSPALEANTASPSSAFFVSSRAPDAAAASPPDARPAPLQLRV
jgi:hypothetical protein